ncbi:MAG TPA: acyltransferase [Candidatus Eisenbacteria bacterium]|nr:acyltransferase [Candidatus Eisenbacteria bacterium]
MPAGAVPPRTVARRALADPLGTARIALATARARVALRGCREVGYGPRLYGRCLVSGGAGIHVGERLLMIGTAASCELHTHDGGRLEIGDRVFVNYGSSISAHTLVRIGDDCKIGQHAIILDCDYHDMDDPLHYGGHGESRPVVLEAGVWLGVRVTVLKGVTIGRSSVVAAGSVVTRDIPPCVLAGGMPAKVLRRLELTGRS